MTALFLQILNRSISASWLILAVLVLRFILKKAPKWINLLLWSIVVVRLICPFSVESALSLIPSAQTIAPEILTEPAFDVQTGISAVDTTVNDYLDTHYYEGVSVPNDTGIDMMKAFSLIWGLGIVFLLIYTAVSYFWLDVQMNTAVLLRDNIYQSENVTSPFVLGVIEPKIYIPFQMQGESLEYVIAHEEAHIQRRDHWWKLLGFFVVVIHWFHPLVWVSYACLCRDIEYACDEKVIRDYNTIQKADYSQTLLSFGANGRVSMACPLSFGEISVKERVSSILKYKKPEFWVVTISIIFCAVLAACFLTDPKIEEPPSTEEYKEHFSDSLQTEESDTQIIKGNILGLYDQDPKQFIKELAVSGEEKIDAVIELLVSQKAGSDLGKLEEQIDAFLNFSNPGGEEPQFDRTERRVLSKIKEQIIAFEAALEISNQTTEEKEAYEFFQTLYKDYQTLMPLITHPDFSTGKEVMDENGSIYLSVEDETYKSIKDIRNFMEKVFSEKYIEQKFSYVFDGETPFYKEIDGQLYVLMADAPGLGLPNTVVEIEVMDDNSIHVITKDTEVTWEITLVKENNRWVISQEKIQ